MARTYATRAGRVIPIVTSRDPADRPPGEKDGFVRDG